MFELEADERHHNPMGTLHGAARRIAPTRFRIEDFRVRPISADVVLAPYRAAGSLRSSLWICYSARGVEVLEVIAAKRMAKTIPMPTFTQKMSSGTQRLSERNTTQALAKT